MSAPLRRAAALTRAEDRTVSGVAIRYGDLARLPGGQRERFVAGSVTLDDPVVLNLEHDRTRPLARHPRTLQFEDGAEELRFTADLPVTREADDALALIEAGVLDGASVEFWPVRSSSDGKDVIVREAVRLVGLALVTRPAYPASRLRAEHVIALPRRPLWVF